MCDKHIPCTKKSQVTKHVLRIAHKNGLKRKLNIISKHLFSLEATSNAKIVNDFNKDLCLALAAANINWYKMQILQFRTCLKKYTKKHIPDESALSKNYLGLCYDKTLSEIKNIIGENNIWIVVDVTTDTNGRYVANLLIGILKSNTLIHSFLLACKFLEKLIIPLLHDLSMMD